MKFLFGFRGAELLPQGSIRAPKGITKLDREQVKIAVIDDETFQPRLQLQRLGYDAQELQDIKELDEVEGFDIALIDLMGVGMKFDIKNQGAFLVKEIRRNHPSVFICIYSGADNQSPLAVYARQNADMFIKKDEDVDTITEKLDELAIRASSPAIVWRRLRQALVDQGVSTKDILILEHEYVTQFLSRAPSSGPIVKLANSLGISKTAKDIVVGLVSSYIFKAISG